MNLNSTPLNSPITQNEFEVACKINKNTSPGPDGIPYKLLFELPEICKNHLLKIYSFIWEHDVFSDQWRIATILPIPKPNKDKNKSF